MLLVLLCGAFGYLVRANTTDAQLGALGPSTGPARDISNITTVQLLSAADAAAPSSTGASEEGAKLPLASKRFEGETHRIEG